MKKYFLLSAIALFMLAFFNSCYYDKNDFLNPTRPNQPGATCDTTNVTYGITIKPVFDNYCNGCHSTGSFDFSSYATLSSYLSTNSQTLLNDINYTGTKQMPPSGKLSDCYLKQIGIWINAGYPNN